MVHSSGNAHSHWKWVSKGQVAEPKAGIREKSVGDIKTNLNCSYQEAEFIIMTGQELVFHFTIGCVFCSDEF